MRLPFVVVRSPGADRDLEQLFDHLFETHLAFGESDQEAQQKAEDRMVSIHASMERLGTAPFQGTLRQDLMPTLRNVTKDQAIFWFTVDEPKKIIQVLAIFYGGQDHQRRMLKRLLGGE